MDNQEKIAYLKQYKSLDKQIDRLLEEREIWKSRAMKVTQTLSDMPKAKADEDSRQNAIVKMIEADIEATRKIDQLVDLGRVINRQIDNIEDAELRLILQYRYIAGIRWEEIAFRLNYSWRNTHYMHSKALSKLCIELH